MLADLHLVGCKEIGPYSETDSKVLLASAKANLKSLAFFGLSEKQKESQYLFEEVFRLAFAKPLEQVSFTFLETGNPIIGLGPEPDMICN